MPTRGTKTRPFRIPDDLYEAAKAKADTEGVTVTSVVIAALREFVNRRK